MEKKCNMCNKILSIENFNPRQGKCKVCQSIWSLQYRKNNKEKIKQYAQTDKFKNSGKKWRENNKEKIKKNNIKYNSLPSNKTKTKEYNKNYNSIPENKEKQRLRHNKYSKDVKWKKAKSNYNKEWNKNNREKIKIYNELWNESNRNYIKEYNSSPKTKEKTNKRRRERYGNDPYFKLTTILRVRFNQVVKNKSTSTLRFLSCSIYDLKCYLESLFLPEMNWDNYGEIWEIDHILPCASFNLNKLEEQKKCFHYTNLQPLFKTTRIAEDLGYSNQVGNRNKKDKLYEKN